MKQYVGLDISMEDTIICVLDQSGAVTFEGCASTNPLSMRINKSDQNDARGWPNWPAWDGTGKLP